jgi:hypothetical protein
VDSREPTIPTAWTTSRSSRPRPRNHNPNGLDEVAEAGELPASHDERGLLIDRVEPELAGVLGGSPAAVGAALAADGAEGGRVAAALGGEVPAEAEHVQPLADAGVGVKLAEVPAGPQQPGDVRADAVAGQCGAGLPAVAEAEVLGGLGGGLGAVGGGPLGGQLAAGVAVDRLHIDLVAEPQRDGAVPCGVGFRGQLFWRQDWSSIPTAGS